MISTTLLTIPASVWWSVSALAALVTAGTAMRAAVSTRGSTAVPATLWAIAACLSLALDTGLRASGAISQPSAAASLRMVTAALSLCPAMSLLGAKRPQHGVWQFIVAALAVILLLPTLATALVRPDSVPDAHLLGRALVDSEQAFPPTASTAAPMAAAIDCLGGCLAAVGGLLAMTSSLSSLSSTRRRPSLAPAGTFAAAVEPAFLGFRETLGAAWTLRVAERFDAIAASRGWPCRLLFDGIHPADTPIDGPWQRDAQRALGALLQRFVSIQWLRRHAWPARAGGRLARDERRR